MMNKAEIKAAIIDLVVAEMQRSYEKFPAFNSTHEGYAVIKEEVEEAQEELINIKESLRALWRAIKDNTGTSLFHADEIMMYAEALAYEAIQAAAMAKKYIESLEGNP